MPSVARTLGLRRMFLWSRNCRMKRMVCSSRLSSKVTGSVSALSLTMVCSMSVFSG